MTKEEIRQEALSAEKENFPRCAADKENSFHGVNSAYGLGFVDGALWANNKSLLISVEDDLPCNHEEMVHVNYTDRVLILARNGFAEVAFMTIIEGKWEWCTPIHVYYWMPNPTVPKL